MASKQYTTGKWAGLPFAQCDQCDWSTAGPDAEQVMQTHVHEAHESGQQLNARTQAAADAKGAK